MKKIILTLLLFIGTLFVSCENDSTGNVSKITNYPTFTMNGNDVIYVKKGDPFIDPGAKAYENGVEIPLTTTINGDYRGGTTVNTNIEDIYHISYVAKNKDGFSGSIERTVIVYEKSDLITSISGLYTSTVIRNGVASTQYEDMEYILIWKNSNGTYEMSDGIGGYYAIGRGYGTGYLARPVKITANNIVTNDFATIPPFTVGTFGGVAIMSDLVANSTNKTLSFSTSWDAGYTFAVTLTQVQP